MSNIINADQYIKAGDKVYKVAGGSASGRNIITANSRAELPDPSTVAEGTIAFVPSSGGGGVKIVNLNDETKYADFGANLVAMALSASDGTQYLAEGSQLRELTDVFFAECNTDLPVFVQMSATLGGGTITLDCLVRDKSYTNGSLTGLSIATDLYVESAVMSISLIFSLSSIIIDKTTKVISS